MFYKKLIQLKCDGKPIGLSVIESHSGLAAFR